jgi:phenylacetate-CoA ligase
MKLYEKIYHNLIFPFYSRFIKKSTINDEYVAASKRLNLSLDELKDFQWQRLQKLLNFCWEEVPYYKKSWQQAGINHVSEIKSLADFAKLPVLTKQDVSEHYDELIPNGAKATNISKSTGGSTGQPFHFELDHLSDEARQAIMWRGYGWLGAGLGIKTLFLWGDNVGATGKLRALKESLYHRFYNRKMVSTFSMNSNNLMTYVDEINAYKPKAIVSYVNPLYEIAKYINANKVQVHSPSSLLTGAEPLYEFQRQEIEQAFNSKVYNTYGCREFMLIAAECKQQQGLHINIDHLVVETLSENGDSISDAAGNLVVTDLMNYGMPLIRYVNGDQATLSHQTCCCENSLPMMEKINGRKLDVIKTHTGQMIPGELFPHLFKEFKGINKFQVKQETLEAISISIVKNSLFDDSQINVINAEINRYSKNSLQINYIFVDEIPLTKSGKHRVTVSELS